MIKRLKCLEQISTEYKCISVKSKYNYDTDLSSTHTDLYKPEYRPKIINRMIKYFGTEVDVEPVDRKLIIEFFEDIEFCNVYHYYLKEMGIKFFFHEDWFEPENLIEDELFEVSL